MDSVRKGLRVRDLEKDTYGRLECTACGMRLTRRDAQGTIGSIRVCPDCGREWRRLP